MTKLPQINHKDAPYSSLDPKNVNGRLYDAMSKLLDNFEDMTVREQVATVAAIARIQVLFIKLREEKSEPANVGTAVKRYEKAFQANATGRRKKITGSVAATLAAVRDDDDDLEL